MSGVALFNLIGQSVICYKFTLFESVDKHFYVKNVCLSCLRQNVAQNAFNIRKLKDLRNRVSDCLEHYELSI